MVGNNRLSSINANMQRSRMNCDLFLLVLEHQKSSMRANPLLTLICRSTSFVGCPVLLISPTRLIVGTPTRLECQRLYPPILLLHPVLQPILLKDRLHKYHPQSGKGIFHISPDPIMNFGLLHLPK